MALNFTVSSSDSLAFTTDAAGSAIYPPYIGSNGNWYQWDLDEEQFVDSGMPSRGATGAKGDTGETGAKGDTGATGAKGDTGDDAEIIATEYGTSASSSTQPTTWTSTVPTVTGGNYLWTRYTWNNGDYTYMCTRYGVDGSGTGDMLKSTYSPNYTGELASNEDLEEHTSDSDIHVTASQKTTWSAKQPEHSTQTATLAVASWTPTYSATGTTTVSSGSVTVNVTTFRTAYSTTGTYVFTYDGTDWTDEDVTTVTLATIGITLTGTPSADDTITVVLSSATPYTQRVSVTGVTATNTVIVSPSPSSTSNWSDAEIYCSLQEAGYLTFTAKTTPTSAIAVNIVILD